MIGDPAAIADLLALAVRPRVYVPARVQALSALAALHAASALPVATQLVDAPARDVGRAALRLLAAVPTSWSEPAVIFALDVPGLRGEAALAAAALGSKACGVRLIAALKRDDLEPEERVYVLQALGKLQPPGAGPALLARLDQAKSDEQVLLLHAMPEVGDQTVVPQLVDRLATADAAMANHLIFALENLTGQHLGPDLAAWRAFAGPQAAKSNGKASP